MPNPSRWLTWTPQNGEGPVLTSDKTDKTNVGAGANSHSVSFVGVSSGTKVSKGGNEELAFTADEDLPEPAHNSSEWAGDFRRWREAECVAHLGSSGGVAILYREFCAWCFGQEAVPCNLPAFRALLASEGFSVSERGMALGLLLRQDWEACFPPAPKQRPGRRGGLP